MKVLIIEDEAKTAKFFKKGLSEAGFVVDVAEDGAEGLNLALGLEFDLIMLDLMLPVLDGWLGADDYVVKPFAFSELLARIRSLLRRAGPRPQETLRMADLEIDVLRHRATRAGQRLTSQRRNSFFCRCSRAVR